MDAKGNPVYGYKPSARNHHFLYGPQLEELNVSQGPPPTGPTLYVWHCISTHTEVHGGGILRWAVLPPHARDAFINWETQRGNRLAEHLYGLDPSDAQARAP